MRKAITNDLKLAFKVSELIGHEPKRSKIGHHSIYQFKWGLSVHDFLNDWRIAGQLIEITIDCLGYDYIQPNTEAIDSPKARAFIEACVNSLVGGDE